MKKILTCFLTTVLVCFCNQAQSALQGNDAITSRHTTTHTYTPELKPVPQSIRTAAICFIGDDCGSQGLYNKTDEDMTIDPEDMCKSEGYTKNICTDGQIADSVSPYHEDYNKGCTCPEEYKICSDLEAGSGLTCVLDDKTYYESCACSPSLVTCNSAEDGVGDACGGKYASCQCKPNLVSCNEVQDGVGDACGGKYASCQCKDSLIQCGTNQEGVGLQCDGKYAECRCPTDWSECNGDTEDGGAEGASKCSIGGKDYYSKCKIVEDKCGKNVLSGYGRVVTTSEEFLQAVKDVNAKIARTIIVMNDIAVTEPISFTAESDIKTKNSFRDAIPDCKTDKRPKLTFDTEAAAITYSGHNHMVDSLQFENTGGDLLQVSPNIDLTLNNITLRANATDRVANAIKMDSYGAADITINGDLQLYGNIMLERASSSKFTLNGSLIARWSTTEINLGGSDLIIDELPEGYDDYPVKPTAGYDINSPYIMAQSAQITANTAYIYCPLGQLLSIKTRQNIAFGIVMNHREENCPIAPGAFSTVLTGSPKNITFSGINAQPEFNLESNSSSASLIVENSNLRARSTGQINLSRLSYYNSTVQGLRATVKTTGSNNVEKDVRNLDVSIYDSTYQRGSITLQNASYVIRSNGKEEGTGDSCCYRVGTNCGLAPLYCTKCPWARQCQSGTTYYYKKVNRTI